MIKNSNFIHKIDTDIHPTLPRYIKYWKELKKRCIEGYWFEGKYMPGPLYFYANFGRILMNVNGSKTKSVGQPLLRDVEWIKAYVYMEAKGFSGFIDDKTHTCSEWVKQINDTTGNEEREKKLQSLIKRRKITADDTVNPHEFPNNIKFKEYEVPRTYMKKVHQRDLGRPLFKNNAKNVCDLEVRRVGKSYFAGGGMINHNFLFDGATNYDEYLAALDSGLPLSSETLVGAIDAKYTKDLLGKCQLGLDNLPGYTMKNGIYYPSPLSKQSRGTFAIGKYLEAAYEIKTNGGWVTKGSKSKIHNRSFADNPLAGNGTGPNLIVFEEMGFMKNMIASIGAMKDATYNGTDKFGVIWMTGTGGLGDAAAISDAKEIFYNPKDYDCLEFEDIWEESQSPIGYFVPYNYVLDDFRDSEGVVDIPSSDEFIAEKRQKLLTGGDTKAYGSEIQNNPMSHVEAFTVDNKNIFPVAEMKAHLGWLQASEDGFTKGQCGELVWEKDDPVPTWQPDLTGKTRPCGFRMKSGEDTTGCIQIWEHPKGKPPYGLYIAGTDPYDLDEAPSSVSLGSTFIYKTYDPNTGGRSHTPVAEYTARPKTAPQHHENVRKLLLYFNAVDLYENERNSIKDHFERKNSLHLLAKKPTVLRATEGSKVQREYGTHMTADIKKEMLLYVRDWLTDEAEDGNLNLHGIHSEALLEELINYNDTDNFDRVIAFMCVITLKIQNYRIKIKNIKDEVKVDTFLSRMNKFYK